MKHLFGVGAVAVGNEFINATAAEVAAEVASTRSGAEDIAVRVEHDSALGERDVIPASRHSYKDVEDLFMPLVVCSLRQLVNDAAVTSEIAAERGSAKKAAIRTERNARIRVGAVIENLRGIEVVKHRVC